MRCEKALVSRVFSFVKKMSNYAEFVFFLLKYAIMLMESRLCSMLEKLNNRMIKTVVLYLVYFLYTVVASSLVASLNVENTAIVMMPADILFAIFAVFMYHKELKECVNKLKKKKVSKIIFNVIIGVLSILALNVVMGLITSAILPEYSMDSNTEAMLGLLKVSPIYAFFKTLIFAPIAEEILFRESISSCVKNNVLFILLSAIIYTGMNFVFSSEALTFIDLLIYFMPAVLFSFLYVKNDRNIIIIMMIKFIMQFVPFIVLLLS